MDYLTQVSRSSSLDLHRACSKLGCLSLRCSLSEHLGHLCKLGGLLHSQVQHDLLRASWDGHGANLTVQTLHLLTLTTAGIGQSTEDLSCFAGTVFHDFGALHLAKSCVASQLQHGLYLGHGLQLVGDPLQPVVSCLNLAGHFCNLPANHWVLDQSLAKGLALASKLQGVLQANSGKASAHGTEGKSLMVEILHHVLEAFALFAKQVALWNLDIIKGDVGGAGGPCAAAFHLPALHTFHTLLYQ
mmetsp:Transcript_10358/g.22961  ORF Transcript_10358/g.22961 Transcript_10358/m.22961 type:complete len:244 (+) Transcript_10358:133-864(+)